MLWKRKESLKGVLTVLLILGTIQLIMAQVIATELVVESKTVKFNENGSINITLVNYTETDKLSVFTLFIKYNESIMQVLEVRNLPPDTNYSLYDGVIGISGSPDASINYGDNYTLGTIIAKALRNDGSRSPVEVFYQSFTIGTQSGVTFPTVNGTFTTLDEVKPEITFSANNTVIAGPEINITAVIYDLSGIDTSSIVVKINGTELTNNTHYNVSCDGTICYVYITPNITKLGFSLGSTIKVEVWANDTKNNRGYNFAINRVEEVGFYLEQPEVKEIVNGVETAYVNTTNVAVTIRYVNINESTIEVYVNNTLVNVIPSNGTISFTATLSEGINWINVTGKDLQGRTYSKSWKIIVDTSEPEILYFEVKDSDGDSFIERNENLTASWSVSDDNFERIEVRNGNVVFSNASSTGSHSFSVSDYGDYSFIVYDKAGNSNATTFHIYNNHIAYVVSSQPREMMGLDISRLAALDIMDRDVVNVTVYNGRDVSIPVSSIHRQIVPGAKLNFTVYIQSDANRTITNFYQSYVVYDSSMKPDFEIKASAKGVVLLAKLNDTKAEDKILNLTQNLKLSELIKLKELPELVDYFYFFSSNGWAKARYDSVNEKLVSLGGQGTFVLGDNLTKTLSNPINIVDFSTGFRISRDVPYYSQLDELEVGSYLILSIGIDGDVVALNALMPLIVLNGSAPTVNSVQQGEVVQISFPAFVNRTAAILMRDVTYNASISTNLTESLVNIGRAELIYGDRTLKELTFKGKGTKIWVPEGMVKGGYVKGNNLSIDTSGLEAGDYRVYVVAQEYGGRLHYAGFVQLTVTQDTTPPEIQLIVTLNSTHAVINYSISDSNGLSSAIIGLKYPNETILLNKSYSGEELDSGSIPITLNVPGTYMVYAKAYDVANNTASTSLNFTKPVSIQPYNTSEVLNTTDVELVVESGNQTTNVSAFFALGEATTFNVTSLEEYTPVKYMNVSLNLISGNVSNITLVAKYSDDEITGLDEDTLRLFLWDSDNRTWVDLSAYVGKWIAGHIIYSYQHDKAENRISVKLSNLSIFALGGKRPEALPPTYAASGYMITPTPTPTPTPAIITPTPTATPTPTPFTPTPTPFTPTPTPPKPPVPTWTWAIVVVVLVAAAIIIYLRRK